MCERAHTHMYTYKYMTIYNSDGPSNKNLGIPSKEAKSVR